MFTGIFSMVVLMAASVALPTGPLRVIHEQPGRGDYASDPTPMEPGRWDIWTWAVVDNALTPDAVYGFHTEIDCGGRRIRRVELVQFASGGEVRHVETEEDFRLAYWGEIEDSLLDAVCDGSLSTWPQVGSIDEAAGRARRP